MVFQEGYFNDLLPQLPIQPNGHHKTAKNCHDKWESLKQEYYAASTIAGGSGLAYSTEKGANVMTKVGQLVMNKLIETQPEAAQFQHKGFKFWDHMNQFVPPDKPPFMPPIQHYPSHQPPFMQPCTLHQLQSTQAAAQFTLMQYQTETPDQTQTTLTTQNVQHTVSSQAPVVTPLPAQVPPNMSQVPFRIPANPPTVSPSSIPVSPPSSAMVSVDSSINPSSSVSSHGRKHKSNATAELDTMSVATTTSPWKQWTQMSGLEDKVQEFMASFNNTSSRMVNQTLSTLDNTGKDQKLSNTCMLIYDLEKNLSADNLTHLQMLFEENPSFITGYQHVAAHLNITQNAVG
ncbi:hypothetical protein F5141DRAFT_1221674 [Pisolithus sp. B1]|nr:hypothetical protein F5141DRAFT_1221674 [Pisolithus sp. B1]